MIGFFGKETAQDRRRIEIRNVSKRYFKESGHADVLKDINCTIPYGTNLGIIGMNGAGKSTFMRLLAGVETPSRGRIRRYGSVSWPLARNAGFVPYLTGEENIRFIGRLYRMELYELIEFVRDFSELGDALDDEVAVYSSGMRARLQFAVSIAIPFDFYLVDEIVGVGDQRFQEKCRRAFAERRNQATMVMISHQALTLRQFCDKGCVLHDGNLTEFDNVEDALRHYRSIERQRSTSARGARA